MKPDITAEFARSVLDYELQSGAFRWKVCGYTHPQNVGQVAGGLTKEGYWRIYLKGWPFKAHRIAFLIVDGAWPPTEVDHINGARNDNSWMNLRLADATINVQNRRAARTDNRSTGLLGVTWHKRVGKFQAQIGHNGDVLHIGYFDVAADAHLAYLDRKRKLHQGCTI